MNRLPDVELVLRAYLADTGDAAPDRVLSDVASRIARLPRHRTWRLQGRPFVNSYLKLAAGLGAVAVVALVGWRFVQTPAGGTGSSPAPSASSSSAVPATPAPTSSASAVQPLPNGSMPAGTYGFRPLLTSSLQVVANIPAGWQGYGSFAILAPQGPESPNGIGIGFIATSGLFSDPCHWDLKHDHSWPQAADVTVGPGVDDLVGALAANNAYTSTVPADTSLGGFAGKQLELQLPRTIDTCDKDSSGSNRYMVFSGIDGGLYAQGPENRFRVSIVDVAGTRLIAVLADYASTSVTDRSVAEGILDSLVITP